MLNFLHFLSFLVLLSSLLLRDRWFLTVGRIRLKTLQESQVFVSFYKLVDSCFKFKLPRVLAHFHLGKFRYVSFRLGKDLHFIFLCRYFFRIFGFYLELMCYLLFIICEKYFLIKIQKSIVWLHLDYVDIVYDRVFTYSFTKIFELFSIT